MSGHEKLSLIGMMTDRPIGFSLWELDLERVRKTRSIGNCLSREKDRAAEPYEWEGTEVQTTEVNHGQPPGMVSLKLRYFSPCLQIPLPSIALAILA